VKKPKAKTAAKQRYLHKKATRHKILVKARKESAPKNKVPLQDTGDEIERHVEKDDGDVKAINAENGSEVRKKRKRKDAVKEVDVETVEKAVLPDELEGEVDESVERERRRAEKKAKRALRDHEAKRALKEKKREKTKVKIDKASSNSTSVGQEDTLPPGVDEPMEGGDSQDSVDSSEDRPEAMDPDDIAARSPSPPPLEPFPLPQPPPAPSKSLLASQGLPPGLKDASLVDQSLALPIRELMTTRRGKVEKGISDDMVRKLEDMGITSFFAGMFS
jgi:ATP-dependent RNA helicase DDX51/DBP6